MIEGSTVATQDALQAVDPANVTAGGIGFVVIASLAVGTAILLRSLNKQLKKVDFEEEPETDRGEDKPLRDGSVGDGPEEGPKSSTP